MTRTQRFILCLSLAVSSAGCYVGTHPEHARRYHHRPHHEVVVVHRY